MFGGKKNLAERHYVYKGFQSDKEFEFHLQTLLQWNEMKKETEGMVAEA